MEANVIWHSINADRNCLWIRRIVRRDVAYIDLLSVAVTWSSNILHAESHATGCAASKIVGNGYGVGIRASGGRCKYRALAGSAAQVGGRSAPEISKAGSSRRVNSRGCALRTIS